MVRDERCPGHQAARESLEKARPGHLRDVAAALEEGEDRVDLKVSVAASATSIHGSRHATGCAGCAWVEKK